MEEPLPAGGSCLLGSINLSAYVVKHEGRMCFAVSEFKQDIITIVHAMDSVLEQGLPLHPLAIQKQTVADYRQIGIGVMGIADMLIKLGKKYDTDEAKQICDVIGFELANQAIYASALLAKIKGHYPKYKKEVMQSEFFLNNTTPATREIVAKYGLRNSQLLTIAPTGSISTMIGVSGGIEPIFNLSYTRKTESLHGEDVYYEVFTKIAKDYMDKHGLTTLDELPDYFVTTKNLDPMKRVEIQGVWQQHIDASISSTVNLPNEATVEDVEQLYLHAWKNGLKGMTIYRDGCSRAGILTNGTKDKQESHELKRGEWEAKPNDIIYIQRKLKTGCGKLALFISVSISQNKIFDVYYKKSGDSGCVCNLEADAILMSSVFRLGGDISNIECAFRGMTKCNAFTNARAKGKELSKGTSCPTAILYVLKDVEKDLQNHTLKEFIELGLYDRVDKPEEKKKEKVEPEIIVVKEKKTSFSEEEQKFIEENGETQYGLTYGKCPQCNDVLERTGGCISCASCGWTKCD